jgi:subtilisin-like proprotein convertase family protein
MKHKLLRTISAALASCLAITVTAQDSWTPSSIGGFGYYNNSTVYGMNVFNGQLYVAAGNDSGFVYRSPSGNPGSWTKVFADPAIRSVEEISSSAIGGGNMYIAASADFFDTSRVFRSTDGINWTNYFTSTYYKVSHVIPFKGSGTTDSIYVFESTPGGAFIHKSFYNSNDPNNIYGMWDTVFDMSATGNFANMSAVAVHNNKLYAGSNGGDLWISANGNTWTRNVAVDYGFGLGSNKELSAIGSFGGYVYIGTDNNALGPQLWRSNDDVNWTMIQQFSASYKKVSGITVADGKLWVTLGSTSSPGEVLKSTDGLTFTSSNSTGFGNFGNNGMKASMIEFGNNIYWGGENFSMPARIFGNPGAEIHRLCKLTPPTVDLGPDRTICEYTTTTLDAGSGIAYLWDDGSTSQTIDVSYPDVYDVVVVGANGCSGRDYIQVFNTEAPYLSMINPTGGYPATACLGDTASVRVSAYSDVLSILAPINSIDHDSINDSFGQTLDSILVTGIIDQSSAGWSLYSVTIDSLSHENMGDLEIGLYSPDGAYITLSNYFGSGSNLGYVGTEFRMDAPDYLTSGSPPYTGLFFPQNGFNNLWGNPNGYWRLAVYDAYSGSNGVLKGWTIRLQDTDTMMTYSWTPAIGLVASNTLNMLAHPATTTDYTLTVTNSLGCSATQEVQVLIPDITFPQSHDTVCYGSQLLLAPAGVSQYASWTPSTGLDTTISYEVYASPGVSMTYYVNDTVYGCPIMDSIHVHQNAQLFLNSPSPVTICNSDTAVLTASANGGSAPYTYTWDMGGSYLYGETIYPVPTGGTSFTISATDAAGCTIGGGSTSISVTPSTDVYGHVTYNSGASNVAGSYVVLYEHLPYLTHFDTIQVTTTDASGNYHFPSVDNSNYLIEVFPDASYTTLVPSYYGDVFMWDDATVVTHGCATADTFNIAAVEQTVVTGPGFLHGTIIEVDGFSRIPGDPIPGVDVKLGRNPGGQLVTSTETDANGEYSFANLPYDDYIIYVDIPGLGNDSTYTVTVDATNNTFMNLDYEVDSTEINPVPQLSTNITPSENAKGNMFSVYPNPASSTANIEYTISDDAKVLLGVYNVLGIKVLDIINTKQSSGTYKYSLNNEKDKNLAPGVYFVTLVINDKTNIQQLVISK